MVFTPFGNLSSIYLPSVVGLMSNFSPKFHIPSLVVSVEDSLLKRLMFVDCGEG